MRGRRYKRSREGEEECGEGKEKKETQEEGEGDLRRCGVYTRYGGLVQTSPCQPPSWSSSFENWGVFVL